MAAVMAAAAVPRMLHPSPCLPDTTTTSPGPVLSESQVEQWRTAGFVVVSELLPAAAIAAAIAEVRHCTWPHRHSNVPLWAAVCVAWPQNQVGGDICGLDAEN